MFPFRVMAHDDIFKRLEEKDYLMAKQEYFM